MGNTNARRGAAQPGVEQSDEHPWGLKNITMPIPLEFARRLRNNKELQVEYARFVLNKDYIWLPDFINANEDAVYAKFHNSAKIPKIYVGKINTLTGRFTLVDLLNNSKLEKTTMKPFIGSRGGLFYIPMVVSSADADYKKKKTASIITHAREGYKCMFTDDALLVAAIILQQDSSFPLHQYDENAPIDLSDQSNYTFNEIMSTDISPSSLSINALKAVNNFRELYKTYEKVAIANQRVLDLYYALKDRLIINVTSYDYLGTHINTVIIERDLSRDSMINFYILDSNGVDSCSAAIYLYFADKLSLKSPDVNIVHIMPYEPRETPRAFQSISRGGLCQTWNIFSQMLFILNNSADINKLVYDEVLQYAEPIINSSNSNERQAVNVSLILLEFMFYIKHELFPVEFTAFLRTHGDLESHIEAYKTSKPFLDALKEYEQEQYRLFKSEIPRVNLGTIARRIMHPDFYTNKIAELVNSEIIAWNEKKQNVAKIYDINKDALEHIRDKFQLDEPIDMSMFITDIIDVGL